MARGAATDSSGAPGPGAIHTPAREDRCGSAARDAVDRIPFAPIPTGCALPPRRRGRDRRIRFGAWANAAGPPRAGASATARQRDRDHALAARAVARNR